MGLASMRTEESRGLPKTAAPRESGLAGGHSRPSNRLLRVLAPSHWRWMLRCLKWGSAERKDRAELKLHSVSGKLQLVFKGQVIAKEMSWASDGLGLVSASSRAHV